MQRRNRLVLDRLDRHRVNLLIARRFEQGFRVGAIGLVAAHVSMDVVRRQQPDDVAELFELARPMVRRAARFEQYSGWRLLCKVRKESIALCARPLPERLTLQDRRRWSYAPFGFLLTVASERPLLPGTMMPHRQEESIPSLEPTHPPVRESVSPRCAAQRAR